MAQAAPLVAAALATPVGGRDGAAAHNSGAASTSVTRAADPTRARASPSSGAVTWGREGPYFTPELVDVFGKLPSTVVDTLKKRGGGVTEPLTARCAATKLQRRAWSQLQVRAELAHLALKRRP